MIRKPEWKQDTPKQQAQTLLGSAEGDLLNIQEGIASKESLNRAIRNIKQVQILLQTLPDTTWADAQGESLK